MSLMLERPRPPQVARASLAIDNLRAVVILLVIAFHSILAYLSFLPPQPFEFDAAPFLWRAFPIVDSHRWFGFDLFCAWLDVFLMSFFFLLSGLFTWSSLMRRGAAAFLHDRVLRLGLPFALVVLLLMPLTLYPTYLQTAADPGIAAYWRHWLALPLWPCGPMWFLWLLLVGDLAAAGLYQALAGRRDRLLALSSYARRHPARFLAGVLAASAIAYVPLALLFGPSVWFQRGPFAVQLARLAHYAVYFFAGIAIGACGIERGLLAPDGSLARRWGAWLAAAAASFLLWMGLTALTLPDPTAAPAMLQAVAALSFVAACFAGCFFALGAAVRFAQWRRPALDSLKTNAYGMYLIHYLFVVWLQFALLGLDLPAPVKGGVVFSVTLALSWSVAAALRRMPAIAQIIGGQRPVPTAALRPARARGGSEGLARR